MVLVGLGSESVGIVEQLGAGVEGIEPGQRVITAGVIGTWQEFLVADAAQLLPVPDAVAGQVGADTARALAPGGQLVVYGALSTHRQTDPSALTLPLSARSMIYETKTVRGFWLFRWFVTTPAQHRQSSIKQVFDLVTSGIVKVPEGRPLPLDRAIEALELSEAPAHGGKPLLVFSSIEGNDRQ
jgi:NADPH2:quinone reductase